ncbi:helix-turn-helix domain-containing protein [Pseudomonas sp. TE3610]
MRPLLEAVPVEPASSWVFSHRQLQEGIPYQWHYHPEYELTLTLNSHGYRYIGDDVSAYGEGDLVLVGPGIPHSWCSTSAILDHLPHQALVIKFSQRWVDMLVSSFPEMTEVGSLFERSFQGLSFTGRVCERVIPAITSMVRRPPAARLLTLFEVLIELAHDRDFQVLGQLPGIRSSLPTAEGKIARALNYMHEHFRESLTIPQMAEAAFLSSSGFQRMFKRHTNTTPLEYLVRLRIGKACALLVSTELTVNAIAGEVGYQNLSLFNRQFRKLRLEPPGQFRNRHRRLTGTAAD